MPVSQRQQYVRSGADRKQEDQDGCFPAVAADDDVTVVYAWPLGSHPKVRLGPGQGLRETSPNPIYAAGKVIHQMTGSWEASGISGRLDVGRENSS